MTRVALNAISRVVAELGPYHQDLLLGEKASAQVLSTPQRVSIDAIFSPIALVKGATRAQSSSALRRRCDRQDRRVARLLHPPPASAHRAHSRRRDAGTLPSNAGMDSSRAQNREPPAIARRSPCLRGGRRRRRP